MKLAIDQPNYIPWKGYFDLIHDVDLFIFYNDVQYTVRDWRNRNKIITPHGEKWLSIPCGSKRNRLICDVVMWDNAWQKEHYETLRFAYGKAPFWNMYREFIEDVYLGTTWEYLYELDQYMTRVIAEEFLGIKTKFADSRDFQTVGRKHERLLSLVEVVNADIYESGLAARDYMIIPDYTERGIEVRWKSYEGYPDYPQMSDSFNHNVSILDLLFNVGPDAPYYIWGWREETGAMSYEVAK